MHLLSGIRIYAREHHSCSVESSSSSPSSCSGYSIYRYVSTRVPPFSRILSPHTCTPDHHVSTSPMPYHSWRTSRLGVRLMQACSPVHSGPLTYAAHHIANCKVSPAPNLCGLQLPLSPGSEPLASAVQNLHIAYRTYYGKPSSPDRVIHR